VDSPIVDSIRQNYRPMREPSDSFEIALLCLTKICFKCIGSLSHWTITNINLLLVQNNSLNDLLKPEVGYI